jgi:NTP pyrophosphatase (non-canonical NTP hydrolase)
MTPEDFYRLYGAVKAKELAEFYFKDQAALHTGLYTRDHVMRTEAPAVRRTAAEQGNTSPWREFSITQEAPPQNFRTYQIEADQSAIYPGRGTLLGLIYNTLGLCGETGEFANKAKKLLRDHHASLAMPVHELPVEAMDALRDELGDVLWYLAQQSLHLLVDLGEIADTNLEKLRRRRANGTVHGSGDHR